MAGPRPITQHDLDAAYAAGDADDEARLVPFAGVVPRPRFDSSLGISGDTVKYERELLDELLRAQRDLQMAREQERRGRADFDEIVARLHDDVARRSAAGTTRATRFARRQVAKVQAEHAQGRAELDLGDDVGRVQSLAHHVQMLQDQFRDARTWLDAELEAREAYALARPGLRRDSEPLTDGCGVQPGGVLRRGPAAHPGIGSRPAGRHAVRPGLDVGASRAPRPGHEVVAVLAGQR